MKHSFYLIAGLGKTGLSIARYLQKKQHAFAVFDTRKDAPGAAEFKAAFPDAPVYLQDIPEALISDLAAIIASPGVPLDLPFMKKARDAGVEIYGDIECLAREIKAPVIAITGTNGKSTVTTLVGEIAQAAGLNVAVAGNIGTPVLDLLLDNKPYDLWVLELSSFQLDLTFSLAPVAATILNISPDHLDRHHSMEAYRDAKQRIYHEAQTCIFNRDDKTTLPNPELYPHVEMSSFGSDKPTQNNWGIITQSSNTYLAKDKECIFPVDTLIIKGVHNWLNALAACALAEAAGIALEFIKSGLSAYSGLPHRCQWVRTLNQVTWINDSKGTNIGATLSAINGIGGSMPGKIVLIAGGQGKGADFSELVPAVTKYVRSVILIGEDADKIDRALAPLATQKCTSLEDAVRAAKAAAQAGDVVLLSPACASLDMFRDFNHRGDVFTSCVQSLSI